MATAGTPFSIQAGVILRDSKTVLRNAFIEIRNGRVHAFSRKAKTGKVLDYRNHLLIPGLINAHTHLELSRISVPAPKSGRIDLWIEELIEAKQKQNSSFFFHSALEGARLCLQSGTTTVGEIESHGLSQKAISKTPLRARIYHELLGLDSGVASKNWNQARAALQRRSTQQFRFGLSPHSPYSLSISLLNRLKKAPRQWFSAIHLAESRLETDWLEWQGGALAFLAHWKLLHPKSLIIHGNYLTRAEIKELGKRRASVVYCPGSHHFFRYDRYPLESMLRAGMNVALGTDSLASNRSLSMFREMALCRKRFPRVSAAKVFQMATENGAKALGWDDELGTLRVGKKADFLILDCPTKLSDAALLDFLTQSKPKPLETWIHGKRLFSAGSQAAKTVI